ncbi:MAG: MBL fold metallo-hydrolase [Thermoanaerobaculaceae bacterium]|nr:MBL fold metallo-hydrolase [Thermoanaerobaculaceae bacterium]
MSSVRVAVLASGSSGNATVLEAGDTRVLVDCGLSLRQLTRRLAEVNLKIADLAAVVVTHEHGDHVAGLATLLRRYPMPVLATAGTLAALDLPEGVEAAPLQGGRAVRLGALELLPVATSHDAREPVALLAATDRCRVGLVTDTGVMTELLLERFAGCRGLFLEANHDPDLLRWGPYPWPLKQRIASRTGHLSNQQAQAAVERLAHDELEVVVAMHLSQENNRPELATHEIATPLRGARTQVLAAHHERPLVVELALSPTRHGQLHLFPPGNS